VRNILISQGHQSSQKPILILQDNKSWLRECIDKGKAEIGYLPTEEMFANILTKPVQGSQFIKERALISNWDDHKDEAKVSE